MTEDEFLRKLLDRPNRFATLILKSGERVNGFVFHFERPEDNEDIPDFGDQPLVLLLLTDDSMRVCPLGEISDLVPWGGPAWRTILQQEI